MSSFLNRRKVTLGAVALAVTLGAGVGLSGPAQAAGIPHFPHTVACYKNFGKSNPNRILITDPVRVGDTVKYRTIPQFWLVGHYQHLKTIRTGTLSVPYEDEHHDYQYLCNRYNWVFNQNWPHAQLIRWGA